MAKPLPSDAVLLLSEKQRLAHPEWESGGGGLVSTITDYAMFAQMLLDGGKSGGRQYLSPAAFRQMTTDHMGRAPASRGTTSIFPATALATAMVLRFAPTPEMRGRRRPARSAN